MSKKKQGEKGSEPIGSSGEGLTPSQASEEDIYQAMKDIPGYMDITPAAAKNLCGLAYEHAQKRILSMQAKEIMSSPVHTVREDTVLVEVAQAMDRTGVSGLPVVDSKGGIVGVISEKDFLRCIGGGIRRFMSLVAACMDRKTGLDLTVKGRVARDIMSSPPVTAGPETSLYDIFELLRLHGINRVPITDKGNVVGIITRDDLVHALTPIFLDSGSHIIKYHKE